MSLSYKLTYAQQAKGQKSCEQAYEERLSTAAVDRQRFRQSCRYEPLETESKKLEGVAVLLSTSAPLLVIAFDE